MNAALQALRPDVVLMDLMMPGMNGLEATARAARDFPATRVVVLSMNDSEEFVLQAMRAGAAGYLLKSVTTAELEHAIRAVVRGETYPGLRHLPARRRGVRPQGAGRAQLAGAPHPAAARGAPAGRRGAHHQGDRPAAGDQRQDRRGPPLPADGGPRHPRHRRAGPLRHPHGRHQPRQVKGPVGPVRPVPSG